MKIHLLELLQLYLLCKFNFADACVSVGIISMLLFCRKELEQLGGNDKKKGEKKETSTDKEDNKEDKN